jgi:hypothetical protein
VFEEKLGLSVPLLKVNEDKFASEYRVITVTSPVTAKPVPAWLTLKVLDHNRTRARSREIFLVSLRFIKLWRVIA